ncbi:MAG: tetratricopeptide repeat protein [bacterium]
MFIERDTIEELKVSRTFTIFLFLFFIPALSLPVVALDDAYLAKAVKLHQQGKYGQAAVNYEKAAKNKQAALKAHLGLARLYFETGDYVQAQKISQKALARFPANPTALTLIGKALLQQGNYGAARSKFHQALQAEPGHLLSRLELGMMQSEWGESEAARQTLNYFISYYHSQPNLSAEDLNLIAQACVYLDRVQDANDLFYRATQQNPKLWQAYIYWGNLFLSKYNVADAIGVFEDALKINPNAAEAHLGLAKCWKASDFDKAQEEAEKALNINPNLVHAHNLLAEIKITLGDYEAALKKLSSAFDVNPNALNSRILRALCFFALKDDRKFKDEESAILAVNPKFDDLYFEVAEFLTKRYLFKESVVYYRKALHLNPLNWLARAGLGTSLSRLGEEQAAKEELEKAFEKDPYNRYVGNVLRLFDDFPQYKTHHFQNFTIRIHEKDDAILSGYVKELVAKSYTALVAKYNLKETAPVILEIFPEHDDFAVRCFGLPGAQAFLGICFGNVVAMDSPRARSTGDFVWGETLWHELVHVTHLRLSKNRIPRWLAEGIAVYETTNSNPYWNMNLHIPFIHAFQSDRILHLKDLDAGFNRPTSPGQVTLSYFQASLVVEYLVEKYGIQKLLQTFEEFKAGIETKEVFQRVYSESLDALNDGFRNRIKQKYKLDSVDYSFKPREWRAHSEQPGENLLKKLAKKPNNPFLNYQLGMYYKKNGEFEPAISYLSKAKELFPHYVTGENPYTALADIYLRKDQKKAAVSELIAYTRRNGKNSESLKLLADISIETENYQSAVQALSKLIFITPFEAAIHKKLASVYLKTKKYDLAIKEFKTQLLTQPQDLAGAHCDLADAYLQAGFIKEAKKSALASLEIAPGYEKAQEILLACIESTK